MRKKYIFVVGGVMSGIGKGVTTSSLGALFSCYGNKVNIMKVDPYLNVDAGTMAPTEHGEVFVLDSGLETDQDMGNYERFLNRNINTEDYVTSGMVYKKVIDKERALGYKGKCVEGITDVVAEIKDRILKSAEKSKTDIQLIEIGGTIGDYQNSLFFEAARQMKLDKKSDVAIVMVSYLPSPEYLGEVKTRPTQNSIQQLRSHGIDPDFVVARCDSDVDSIRKEKISRACNIPLKNIINAENERSIYNVVLKLHSNNFAKIIAKEMGIKLNKPTNLLTKWKNFSKTLENNKKGIKVAIVGKYFENGGGVLSDSYISIIEALKFSCAAEGVKPEVYWLKAKDFEDKKHAKGLSEFDAIVVPGGFGERNSEGKINVIQFARENNIPILGICLGMHFMVVEFMRNVVGKKKANSTEVDKKTPHPVITILENQKKNLNNKDMGGSMRLGGQTTLIKKGTLLESLYKNSEAVERHRHRYEVNPLYVDEFEKKGLKVSGVSSSGLVESVELDKKSHKFFVGVQFHPEFTARPFSPNPLFTGLIKAAKK